MAINPEWCRVVSPQDIIEIEKNLPVKMKLPPSLVENITKLGFPHSAEAVEKLVTMCADELKDHPQRDWLVSSIGLTMIDIVGRDYHKYAQEKLEREISRF